MGGVFYLAGVALSAYAGYSSLQWYFIFIASLIMTIGYFISRAPTIHGIVTRDGVASIPKLLALQLVVYSIVTAPIYFIAGIF